MLDLNYDQLLKIWLKLKKEEEVFKLVSIQRNDFVWESFDPDGSDYCYEFQDWVQKQVAEAVEVEWGKTDWQAIARDFAVEFKGSYYPKPPKP